MTKVAVAMSGGVDSSVTAALMVEKYGKENVFGVTMRLFCYGEAEADEKACCSIEAVNDAKKVCDQLGIAHYAINLEKEFEEVVIKNFISEYQKGHTPIPCVICNTVIKFEYLLNKVQGMGADYLATGHYVQIREGKQGFELIKGTDPAKDQSYFLYGLTQDQLSHTLFPVGDIKKTETRKIAAKLGLKTAKKKESQGICFVVGERVTDYLRGKVEVKHGDIVDMTGKKVADHDGVIYYTVGQRKRIGGGYKDPMYVIKVDAAENRVIIGTEKDLYQKELRYIAPTWIKKEPPKLPHACSAKIRYNMDDAKCVIEKSGQVKFKEPQRAITPGQSVVFYENNVVLGGAIIEGI
jgi:tRNA-uridine 2-sulfurtransferase